jgi:nicotinamide riboside kinase
MNGHVIAIVGAESTGKTTLAGELQAALQHDGRSVALVGEYLREFCDQHARTPRIDEQAGIAQEQTRRIAAAAATH